MKRNEAAEKILQFGFQFGLAIVAGAHVVPGLCPLLYIAVDYPPPDSWFTPYGIHEV